MERILKNERRVEGDCKRYLLRYTLVSNGFPKEEGEGIKYLYLSLKLRAEDMNQPIVM